MSGQRPACGYVQIETIFAVMIVNKVAIACNFLPGFTGQARQGMYWKFGIGNQDMNAVPTRLHFNTDLFKDISESTFLKIKDAFRYLADLQTCQKSQIY